MMANCYWVKFSDEMPTMEDSISKGWFFVADEDGVTADWYLDETYKPYVYWLKNVPHVPATRTLEEVTREFMCFAYPDDDGDTPYAQLLEEMHSILEKEKRNDT